MFVERFYGTGDMSSDEGNAPKWCALAAEARTIATTMADPEARRIMRQIAEGYERLAMLAGKRRPSEAWPESAS